MTRNATKLSAGLLLCAAFLAGCGGGSDTGEVTDSAPSSTAPSCPTQVDISEADSGQTVCVGRGGTLSVSLKNTAGESWTPLQPGTPGILTNKVHNEAANNELGLWTASKVGQTTLTSTRPNCPSAVPGTVSCHSVQSFTLVVKVS